MNDDAWRVRAVGAVTRLFAHYGRNVMPTTIADVASDLRRWTPDEIDAAAAEVRRNVATLRDASLSALLLAELRAARRRESLSTPLLPRRPSTPEEREAAKKAVQFVRRLRIRGPNG